MKKFAAVVIILLFAAGVVYARDYEVTKKAGAYQATVRIDKNPPITGDNGMAVKIKDASGRDVTDAAVKVEYSMPAMPGMPAMTYKANAALSGTEYRTKVNFPMSGAWNVSLKITRGGKPLPSVRFNVDVH